VTSKDIVYDLGCGDGRILISAAKDFGARGVGVDFDPERIKEAKAGARKAGVGDLLAFRIEDATKTDFSGATVLALYLLPESLELLRPRIEQLLQPGARVVCHDYPVPGWKDRQAGSATLYDSSGNKHTIFFFRR
jgi:cyclopropane fatty-acyl-phospholipid synthase-like methyltransferase